MKKKNVQDERVTIQQYRVNSESFGVLMFLLIGAIFIQQFILNAPFTQYIGEGICLFVASMYMMLRYITLGFDLYGTKKDTKLFQSVLTGIIITVLNGFTNYTKYAQNYKDNIGYFIGAVLVMFISSTIFIYMTVSLFNYLSKKRQEKIQKQLDKDEQDE